MTIGVPGQYRWLRYHPVYGKEQISYLLPIAFGHPAWVEGRLRSIGECVRGTGSCNHNCHQDQWGEGCIIDGDHYRCIHEHNGHDACGFCICVDPGSIRGSGDGRESDSEATRIDLETAWKWTGMSSDIREALRQRHTYGFSQDEIARRQGVNQSTASRRLDAGHKKIADHLNGVSR